MLNLYERFTAALNALNSSGKALLIATCPERLLYYGTNFNFLTEYQVISVNITQYPVQNNFEIILPVLN